MAYVGLDEFCTLEMQDVEIGFKRDLKPRGGWAYTILQRLKILCLFSGTNWISAFMLIVQPVCSPPAAR